MKNALITGASNGIGKELAYLMAQDKVNLILVARSLNKLQEIAADIKSKFGVEVEVLQFDLSDPQAASKIFEMVTNKGIFVDVLVNNAGFGDLDKFSSKKLSKYEQMINLNIMTLTQLTALFVEKMKEKKSGYILNVASTAAFQPLPYFSVYAATKAYVLSFSEALHFELKKYGVKVSALCPGPTDTGFAQAADIKINAMFDEKKMGMSAQKVAQIAYKKMKKGKMTIVTGFLNKLNAYFSPKMPARCLVPKLMEKEFSKMISSNENLEKK